MQNLKQIFRNNYFVSDLITRTLSKINRIYEKIRQVFMHKKIHIIQNLSLKEHGYYDSVMLINFAPLLLGRDEQKAK